MKKSLSLIMLACALSAPAMASTTNSNGPTNNNYYDQSTTNAPTAIASSDASALGIGTGGSATAFGGTGIGGGATIEKGAVHNANLNLVDVSNRIDNKNTNTNLNVNGQDQAQKQQQEMVQLQGQQQQANNAQSQNMTGSNNAKQVVEFKSAKYLPGMTSAPVGDTRAPELMLNQEQAMIAAANVEIDQTLGKALLNSHDYSAHGCTASVSYSDTECSVHVFPTGNAKSITPNKLEQTAYEAAKQIGMHLTKVVTRYVSIENHSNGLGAGTQNSSSIADPVRSMITGVAGALTGGKSRTSQRVRIELVYVGQK